MPRQIATGRIIAVGRVPVTGRKLIGPPDHNKLWIVLDTGLFIAALIASKRKHYNSAPYRIVNFFVERKFYLITTYAIINEYEKQLQVKITQNLVDPIEVSRILNIIKEKSYAVRVFVDRQVSADKGRDDHMFDYSHRPDYIVTMDIRLKKEISKSEFQTAPLIQPGQFLKIISNKEFPII